MSTEGRTSYLLTRILEDPCQCSDDLSAASLSVPSLTHLPLPGAGDRSSSALSAPPVDRFSPTSSLASLRQPVRRTHTISGRVMHPPSRQAPPPQRAAALSHPSK